MRTHVAHIRAWMLRSKSLGKEPNTYEIWNRIRRTWPSYTEAQHDEIFRGIIESNKSAKGGYGRAQKLSPERRSEIAKHAAETRWRKVSEPS